MTDKLENFKKIKKSNLFGILISLLLVFFIFYKIDFKQLIVTFKTFDWKILLYIIPLYLLCQWIRGFRWRCLLMGDDKMSSALAGVIFSVGTTLNTFLPARAGDIWRAYYVGKEFDESKMKVFGSIILERIFDGLSVVLILLVAVFSYSRQDWILNIAYASCVLFLGGLLFCYLVFKFDKIDVICDFFIKIFHKMNFKTTEKIVGLINVMRGYSKSFLKGFESLNSFKYTAGALLTSFVTWYIECFVTLLLLKSFGFGLGFSASLFVISFIALSAMIPSASVFVGPYQYAYILALGIFHLSKSSALAIALVHQTIIIAIVTAISIVFFIQKGLRPKDFS